MTRLSRQEAEAALPDADVRYPRCGSCGYETEPSGVEFDHYECARCKIRYDAKDHKASYIDPDAEPCGVTCWRHDVGVEPPGYQEWECLPCPLPSTHWDSHGAGHFVRHRKKEVVTQ